MDITTNAIYSALETADQSLDMVHRGDLNGVVIVGPPGIGKGHTGQKVAKRHDHPWRPERPGSAVGLLRVIKRHQHGGVINFDDMDGIWDDGDAVNILKVFLDNKERRILSHTVGGHGYSVGEFEAKSGAAFFTNRNFDNPKDFNSKIYRTGIQAIKDRSAVIALPFDPLALYEYTGWLATEGGMLKRVHRKSVGRTLNLIESNEVLEHYALNAARYPNISPRTLVKFATWRVGAERPEWLRLVENQLRGSHKLPARLEQFCIVPKRSGDEAVPEPSMISKPAPVKKRYWLTPPELYRKWDDEFHFDFDACPHPRPDGFDGLVVKWGRRTYANIPFTGGVMAWVKKAIAEYQKGKLVVMVLPLYQERACHVLIEAGAEMRPIGAPRWLALEDGSPSPAKSVDLPLCALFILRPTPAM